MISDFDKNLNISYIEEDLPTPNNKLIIKHILCSYLIYFLIYLLLFYNPFFQKYFVDFIQHIYQILFMTYVIIAPIIFFTLKPKSIYKSHNIEVFDYFVNIFKKFFNNDTIFKKDYKSILTGFIPTYNQKQALMLLFIKVFFGTLMVKFLYNDIIILVKNLETSQHIFINFYWNIEYIKNIIIQNCDFFYSFALLLIFIVDLSVFIVGYLSECAILNNKIRTVEINITGIIFCLMCYPPFNIVTHNFFGWNQNDNAMAIGGDYPLICWILRIIGVFCMIIYTWASVALGSKASNLTNRGTVSKFPYNIIRHPAYICKNMFWLFTTLPLLFVNFGASQFNWVNYLIKSLLIICSWFTWAFIYYMRAITEERHMGQDPEYQEYMKKVPYRFIPGIF